MARPRTWSGPRSRRGGRSSENEWLALLVRTRPRQTTRCSWTMATRQSPARPDRRDHRALRRADPHRGHRRGRRPAGLPRDRRASPATRGAPAAPAAPRQAGAGRPPIVRSNAPAPVRGRQTGARGRRSRPPGTANVTTPAATQAALRGSSSPGPPADGAGAGSAEQSPHDGRREGVVGLVGVDPSRSAPSASYSPSIRRLGTAPTT